jgi:3-phosphoshikimate 1-carboxyvinyltransferase
LRSQDVLSALNSIKKLGIHYNLNKKYCEIYGRGFNGFSFKNNIKIEAGNSGTLSRLIFGLLINSKNSIILKGDQSLSQRDFLRVIKPMKMFGQNISSKNNKLPIKIKGTNFSRPINYTELKGSAQVKSCILLAAMKTAGKTKIKCVPSRDHTEKLFSYLKLPIKIKKEKKFETIIFNGKKNYKGFSYIIPGDISSSSFFIALALLSKNSKILIKNVNVNDSRTGIIDILKIMNAKINLQKKRTYNGEKIADIFVKSSNKLKPINCPIEMNSRSIDEFLIIFLVCSVANGVSKFRQIGELRNKETDRLKFANNFLKKIGIKTKMTKNSFKIYGKPNLKLNKTYEIKNFDKDHRACMVSFIAALALGGKWIIHDIDSIKTSFPNFIQLLKNLGAKIN